MDLDHRQNALLLARGRARELHRDAGSVAARDVELPGLPPTVATGRMRTLVGGAERHGIGG